MKRFLYILLLLLPQWIFAQYKSKSFQLSESQFSECVPVGLETRKDTSILFTTPANISELYISGTVFLQDKNHGHVRVILQDDYNAEYLVYEIYPLLADSTTMHIQKTAMETKVLDNLTPQGIRIEAENATFLLDSIYYVKGTSRTSKRYSERAIQTQSEQCQYIVDKLNLNLEKRHMLWRAGVTSVSKMTYEEKKSMFGGNVPNLDGFEHYVGGVFIAPEVYHSLSVRSSVVNNSQYVRNWDWRNRHGRNWITSIKDQGLCGACWAFAAVAALEAYVNLYYNQQLNCNLSEQELISCTDSTVGDCGGGKEWAAQDYIDSAGIVCETCFPYLALDGNCSDKCEVPYEKISLDSINYNSVLPTDDQLKEKILKAPIAVAAFSWSHSMSIIGYKGLELNDTVYYRPFGWNVVSDSTYMGKTAWLVKNSWGTDWGSNGYAYIIDTQIHRYTSINGRIQSLQYSDNDIMITDADGDGYYFWGIGPKPTHCPSWVPNTPDGDDSDYSKGPMDAYGNLQETADLLNDTIFITTNTTWSQKRFLYSHVVITNNATLTVNDSVIFYQDVTMTLQNGGKLTLNNGHLLNAAVKINGNSANSVNISNNGSIELRQGQSFSLPLGNNMNLNYGKIQ